jgi:hypothetical protein
MTPPSPTDNGRSYLPNASSNSQTPAPLRHRALSQTCCGPGQKEGENCDRCAKPDGLCHAHTAQMAIRGELRPIQVRMKNRLTATCPGPASEGGGICARPVTVHGSGLCKTHHEQQKRSGSLHPIRSRVYRTRSEACSGPGVDGAGCAREARSEPGLCFAHYNQKRRSGRLKPLRSHGLGDVRCEAPGLANDLSSNNTNERCGRPAQHKGSALCGGHLAQQRRGQPLSALKTLRPRGTSLLCIFPGCRYSDAPDAQGYCQRHWRQILKGQNPNALPGRSHRGRGVLLRDQAGNKLCPSCERWLPELSFTRAVAGSDGLNHVCRHCHASRRMEALYGITLGEFDGMLVEQAGGCAICDEEGTPDRRLSVDHDHACCAGSASCGNCIRGLLCPNCNRSIGLFRDRVDLLERAIEYLRRQRSPRSQPGSPSI